MDFTARILLLSVLFELVYLLVLYLFAKPHNRRSTDAYNEYDEYADEHDEYYKYEPYFRFDSTTGEIHENSDTTNR